VVHRALFEEDRAPRHTLKQTADHLSNTERNSADAERDSKEVKLYAFLTAQLESGRPQPYPALVTDVRNFGFFVDVPELGLSGLVHLSSMADDFYMFDPARNQLAGRRTRRVIRLGDRLTVQIAKSRSLQETGRFPPRHDDPRNRAGPTRHAPNLPVAAVSHGAPPAACAAAKEKTALRNRGGNQPGRPAETQGGNWTGMWA
jgi:ribonuclease R